MYSKLAKDKSKLNHILWSSMSAYGVPGKFDYSNMAPEQFLRQYIGRQLATKKESYLKIINADKAAALEVAGAVIKLRSGATSKRVQNQPSDRPDSASKSIKVNIPSATLESSLQTPEEFVTIFVDAGTQNNGRKGFQKTWVALANMKAEILDEQYLGDKTNNEGEILAIIHALKFAAKYNKPANIYSDSMIAIKWALVGRTKAATHADHLAKEAFDLLKSTGSRITWVSRELNRAGWYLERERSI